MSEVLRDTQHDFWRPPVASQEDGAVPSRTVMVEACDSCATEFMVGARYCYVCGAARQTQSGSAPRAWMRYLEFNHIKQALGLSVASLIAFLAGLGCLVAAIFVGAIYAVQNFADFQAIQLWRMQWLLAAVAAFLAGILLKHSKPESK